MKRQLLVAYLWLVFAPPAALCAAPPAESALTGPFVESAALQPTEVGFAGAGDPHVRLRLEDPSAGGVLVSGLEGSAVLLGPPGDGTFSARVAIDFLEANTSVEVRVIDADGAELNSVVLSSPNPGRWSGSICEVASSQNSRIELSVKQGRALGTAYRIGHEYVTTVPILSRAVSVATRRGTTAFARSLLPARRASVAGLSTGDSNYTSNYQWPGTYFFFLVQGGPPNTCGDIHTFRNGSWVVSNDWLCTDGYGYGAMGPWFITSTSPGQDQTDNPTYIQWPDQTTTTSTWSVIDVTPPSVVTPLFAYGPCPPGHGGWYCPIGGHLSDGQWGSGFSRSWTDVWVSYKDETSQLCFDTYTGLFSSSCPYQRNVPVAVPVDGTPVSSADWYDSFDPSRCPANHYCSATIWVRDIWSQTVQTVPLSFF
jgi:hypothetical protein